MKNGMTIGYLECREDLNFEVDFRVNGTIGTIVTKWDLIFLKNGPFLSIIIIFFNPPLQVRLFVTHVITTIIPCLSSLHISLVTLSGSSDLTLLYCTSIFAAH